MGDNVNITLTPQQLLDITRDIKAGMIKRQLTVDAERNFSHKDVKVTRDDIDAVADALKWHYFFLPTCVYNEAASLAGLDKS